MNKRFKDLGFKLLKQKVISLADYQSLLEMYQSKSFLESGLVRRFHLRILKVVRHKYLRTSKDGAYPFYPAAPRKAFICHDMALASTVDINQLRMELF